MNYSEVIFDSLANLGFAYCCCVPGGGIMYLVDAVGTHPRFKTRFFHHEQAAGFAAEAYGRAEGKLAVCLVTIGPGVANGVAAAFSCFLNSVPCLFISGAKRSNFETNYSAQRFSFPQDGDTNGMTKPVVKQYHCLVPEQDPHDVVRWLTEISKVGRPGPVWLDIPLDVQGMVYNKTGQSIPFRLRIPTSEERNPTQVILDFLQKVERPVFLLGRGCEKVFRNQDYQFFLGKAGIPFITTIGSNHLLKSAGCLNLGFFGPTGRRAANRVLTEADAIVALGSGLDIDSTGFDRRAFFQNKAVLTVNSDPDLNLEEPRYWQKVISCISEIRWDSLIDKSQTWVERFAGWATFCREVEKLLSVEQEINLNLTEYDVDPYLFCWTLITFSPDATVFVGGISLDVHAFSHVAKLIGKQEFYLSPHAGQLGWDLPASIGLADTQRYQNIVCLTGDGSLMFNLQELATLGRVNQAVSIFIFDNGGYNSIRSTQDSHLAGRRVGSDLRTLAFPDWQPLAQAFGYQYLSIEHNDDIQQVQTCLQGGKWLVRVKINPERCRTPRLISRVNNGKFVSPKIFNQYPDLPDSVERAYCSLRDYLWVH
jgi:acetolactate synthase-1/2/3 large subunit